MIYIGIMIMLIVMSYVYDYRGFTRNRNVCFWMMLLIFILVAGLRYRLGQDTIVYIKNYANIHPLDQLKDSDFQRSRFAPGYILLVSFFKGFTSEFTVFQLFHSIFVNTVFFLFLRKHARHLFTALFLFFIYMYFLLLFQQMRESLAVGVFLLAWPAFRNKNWLLWYAASFVAVSFHVSASMMFLLPLICFPGVKKLFHFNRMTLVICIGIFIVGFIINRVFFHYIQMLALTESIMERAQVYSKSDLSVSFLNFNGVMGRFIQSIIYPLIAIWQLILLRKKKEIYQDKNFDLIEMFMVMSLYISMLSIPIPILSRYNNYFYIFSIIILSDWLFSFIAYKRKTIRLHYIYWVMLITPMVGLQIYNSYFKPINKSQTLSSYMVYYPYSSYFDQTLDEDREKFFKFKR